MELHKNARTCPASRLLLVRRVLGGMPVTGAASAAGVSRRTAFKWRRRFTEAGEAALVDRSSRPLRMPRQAHPDRVEEVLRLRHRRYTGPEIAVRVGLGRPRWPASWPGTDCLDSRASSSRSRIADTSENVRANWSTSISRSWAVSVVSAIASHGNRRQNSRGIGWEFVHVAIDDASRLAYAEVLPNQRSPSSIAFLRRSLAWFQDRGIRVESVMSDNGSCYVSRRFKAACQKLQLRHLRTRPYRPRTNGKAERFIQTLLREWAYKRPYATSVQRADRLPRYLNRYNLRRPPHSTNAPQLSASVNNLLRTDN